jgi:hypothetical protein
LAEGMEQGHQGKGAGHHGHKTGHGQAHRPKPNNGKPPLQV